MKKIVFILIILALISIPSHARQNKVYVTEIKGIINQGAEQHFEKAVEEAKDGMLLIVKIDTPGGMANSMDKIIEEMMNSKVPVIIYVAPSGAQAFSAGTYILMASDLAAMAPATTIGACQPRIMNPATGMPEEAPQKEINAYAAKMRSLAIQHKRNATLAEEFVTENKAINERVALQSGVIEVIASNISDLLRQIDGMKIKNVTVNAKNVRIYEIKWGLREKIIGYLSDPSIASLLLTIGMLGLFIGFFTPTFHLPETIGAIFIILALYGLSYIGINAAGILLIILGVVFLIIEAHTPTFGFWTFMAILSLIFGIILIPSPSYLHEMPKEWFIMFRVASLVVITIIASFFGYAIFKVAKAKRKKPKIGEGDLIGFKGIALTDIKPTGQVKVRGEIWKAESEENIKKGEEILVVGQENLKLKVRRA